MVRVSTLPKISFHQSAERLKRILGGPFALQVGAMDGVRFDLLHPHLTKGGWRGLLVEPVEDMFKLLQETYSHLPDIRLAMCAVADYDGTLTLKRVNPLAVTEGLIPQEALGITTSLTTQGLLNDPRLLKAYPNIAGHIIEFNAPCHTLATLLEHHHIAEIDLVMIDTEGADWLIARQLDLARYHPRIICLEHSSLAHNEIDDCLKHFAEYGFQPSLCEEDEENFLFVKN